MITIGIDTGTQTVKMVVLRDDAACALTTGSPETGVASCQANSSSKIQRRRVVFVVHGRNARARDAIFTFLRSIDLYPFEWAEAVARTGHATPYIGQVLDAAFSFARAILVLMTPDDEGHLRENFREAGEPPHETELTGQPRLNVVFEAGMAMGRLGDRTIIVEMGTLRPFSDFEGRHVIKLNNSTQRRQELAGRLRTAGCPVNLTGTAWHTAGDFDSYV